MSKSIKIQKIKQFNPELNKKEVENVLRRYGIEGESAFYLIAFIYYQKKPIKLIQNHLMEKASDIFTKFANDDYLQSMLDSIIRNDPEGQNLSIWYQYFIGRKFRESSGKFFTPISIAKTMLALIPIKKNSVIMDPSSGSGTFLLEASKRWKNTSCELISNDVEVSLADLSNLVLSLGTPRNHKKTILNTNIFEPNLEFKRFFGKVDYILANPPFSLPLKSVKIESELFNFGYKNSDAVFLDICYSLLKHGGKLVTLLPHSIVSNTDYKELRERIEKKWNLLGVISLPEHTFSATSNTTTRADIVLLEKKNNDNQTKNQVVFSFFPKISMTNEGKENWYLNQVKEFENAYFKKSQKILKQKKNSEKTNGVFFVKAVNKKEIQPTVWDPDQYRIILSSKSLRNYMIVSKVVRAAQDLKVMFGPISYRDLPYGEFFSFNLKLMNNECPTKLPSVSENQLLFGTMRAYLGNVFVTPHLKWLGIEKQCMFPIKSEFLAIQPKDGLKYFWWAYLKSDSFLMNLPLGGGETRPRLQKEVFLNISAEVPDEKTRRKIDHGLEKLAKEEWENYMKRIKLLKSSSLLEDFGKDFSEGSK